MSDKERIVSLEKALGDLINHNDLVDEWNLTDPETPRGAEIERLLFDTPCFKDTTGADCPVRVEARRVLANKV